MALWSTYTPVGVSLGLLLSSSFAGTDNWRGGYMIHAVLFGVLALAGWLLPRPAKRAGGAGPRPGLLAAWSQPGPLRVAILFGTLVLTGFGVNTVFPSWYAQQEDLTLGEASGVLGVLNLTMIVGGALTAVVLARGIRHHQWYIVLVVCGLLAAFLMFWPARRRWWPG
jgi:predicted MFS family arabinose efflux permease